MCQIDSKVSNSKLKPDLCKKTEKMNLQLFQVATQKGYKFFGHPAVTRFFIRNLDQAIELKVS